MCQFRKTFGSQIRNVGECGSPLFGKSIVSQHRICDPTRSAQFIDLRDVGSSKWPGGMNDKFAGREADDGDDAALVAAQ